MRELYSWRGLTVELNPNHELIGETPVCGYSLCVLYSVDEIVRRHHPPARVLLQDLGTVRELTWGFAH